MSSSSLPKTAAHRARGQDSTGSTGRTSRQTAGIWLRGETAFQVRSQISPAGRRPPGNGLDLGMTCPEQGAQRLAQRGCVWPKVPDLELRHQDSDAGTLMQEVLAWWFLEQTERKELQARACEPGWAPRATTGVASSTAGHESAFYFTRHLPL